MNVISTKLNIEYDKMGNTNIKSICIIQKVQIISIDQNAPSLDTAEAKLNWIFSIYDADDGGRFQKNTIVSLIHNFVCSIDVVEIMDLVLGLFKISKMEEDMDKIVACVQVQCFILKKCLQYYNNQKMIFLSG